MSKKRIKKKKQKKIREINTERMRRYKSDVARANREAEQAEVVEIMEEPVQISLNEYTLKIKYRYKNKQKGDIFEMDMPFVSEFELDSFLKRQKAGDNSFEILTDFKVTYE